MNTHPAPVSSLPETLLRLSTNMNILPLSIFSGAGEELERLAAMNLVIVKEGGVTVINRLMLATQSMKSGLTPEKAAEYLSWREFETFVEGALVQNGFKTRANFRFKQGRTRREIDVVGLRHPYIICVDCKHWSAANPSALRTAGKSMTERIALLQRSINRGNSFEEVRGWRGRKLVSLIVTLKESRIKLYRSNLIVSIARLNDLLLNIETIADSMLQQEE